MQRWPFMDRVTKQLFSPGFAISCDMAESVKDCFQSRNVTDCYGNRPSAASSEIHQIPPGICATSSFGWKFDWKMTMEWIIKGTWTPRHILLIKLLTEKLKSGDCTTVIGKKNNDSIVNHLSCFHHGTPTARIHQYATYRMRNFKMRNFSSKFQVLSENNTEGFHLWIFFGVPVSKIPFMRTQAAKNGYSCI